MLEVLLDKKGALSRKIGEAKRSGLAIDDLLLEMKQVSEQIKSVKSEQKKPIKPIEQLSDSPEGLVPELFSSVFRDEVRVNKPASDEVVTVKRLEDDKFSQKWDLYVAHKANSSIYHYWEFKRVIQSAFGHKAVYLAAFNKGGAICGVLPAIEMKSRLFGHFIVSLPCFTYGAALADNENIEHQLCTALFQYAEQEKVQHVELRATHALKNLQGSAATKDKKVSMVRPLPETGEQLWKDIGTKVRAQIKKSQRYGLEIKFGKAELLSDFYSVFSTNMRDLGTPVYAKKFFSQLLKSRFHKQFDIGVVYFEAKPVAGCFLMRHNGMMEIPWASALKTANSMNVNMFMYWEVLQKALQHECRFFDFGRSSKDAGTYRFKKQWGAVPQQLYWYYWLPEGASLPELNPDNPKYKLLISVWQRLPVWLTQLIGPPVVKYLP